MQGGYATHSTSMILSENRYPLFGIMLRRVIHLELDRMRRVLEADDLAHLQVDIAVDEVVVEHAADLEEGAILVELFESLAERAAHGRNLLQFLRRQIVEILVDGFARIELVLDTVEAGHQHRRVREIRVGPRVRGAELAARGVG